MAKRFQTFLYQTQEIEHRKDLSMKFLKAEITKHETGRNLSYFGTKKAVNL